MVYRQRNSLIHLNGLWHLFYTSVNNGHNGKTRYGKPPPSHHARNGGIQRVSARSQKWQHQ